MKDPRRSALSLVRPHLLDLAPYEAVDPPEVLAARAGIPESAVVKLNANENPYGPSPKVAEALAHLGRAHIYPDPRQTAMREAVGAHVGLDPSHIVVGNGSDEVIDLLFRAVLGPGDAIIDSVPTFGMYSFVAHVCGGRTVAVERESSFGVDVERVLSTAKSEGAKVLVIASPNNPTGNATPLADVERLLAAGCLVIVDEAYHEFGGATAAELVPVHPNLAVLRTMSKWAGLAGLRVGYGLMAPELADLLLRAKPPYNVSQAAEAALLASLADADTLHERAGWLIDERSRMAGFMSAMDGVTLWPSDANFILCQVGEGRGAAIYDSLARQGVFVRYFRGGRLADFLRISVGRPEETDRFIEAFTVALRD
jgi:histidinol-phosphate aminotransferase